MPIRELFQINTKKLAPAFNAEDAITMAAPMGPNLTVAAGTVLGYDTGNDYYNKYVQKNQVQTLAIAGTLSAGGFRLGIVDKNGVEQITPLIAYNGANSDIQTAINAVIPQESATDQIVVGGTFATANTFTFSGASYDDQAWPLINFYPDGLTGMTSATVSDTTTNDGTNVAEAIATYDFITDADGNVFYGTTVPTTGPASFQDPTAEVYISGAFFVSDLAGLDAKAVADMNGRYIKNKSIVLIP